LQENTVQTLILKTARIYKRLAAQRARRIGGLTRNRAKPASQKSHAPVDLGDIADAEMKARRAQGPKPS